jgi:PAS domain S-box-containing protein
VLYVAAAARSRSAGERALRNHGDFRALAVADAEAAAEGVADGADCVVVEHDEEPPATDALAVLSAVRSVDPAVPVVVFERATGSSVAADAIGYDVTEYVRETDATDPLAAVAVAAEQAASSYRAEQEVAMVNDIARTVYERVTDGFFALNADWEFTYLNAAAEDSLEVDREEVLGRNIWSAFPEAADYAFYDEYHRAMASQEPVTFREHFPPLGKRFEVRAFPAEDGLSVHFRTVVDEDAPVRDNHLLELTKVLSTDLSASLDRLRADLAAVEAARDGDENVDGDPVADAEQSVERMADLVARAEALARDPTGDYTGDE